MKHYRSVLKTISHLLVICFIEVFFFILSSNSVFAQSAGQPCTGTCDNGLFCTAQGICKVACAGMGCLREVEYAQQVWDGQWNNRAPIAFQRKAFKEGYDPTKSGLDANVAALTGGAMQTIAALGAMSPTVVAEARDLGISISPGAVNYMASGIGTMFDQQPAQTATYIADLGKQAGVYNPVYAQDGTGFNALQPILKIWKAFRNMAYLVFVIIFVIIGFMIMFRSKVSQQTVISIQLALPQIIATLLLITFSYAIAALMIDLIYFLIYLIVAIFQTFGILELGDDPVARQIFLSKSLLGIAFENLITPGDMIGQAARGVGTFVEGAINGQIIDKVIGGISSVLAYLIFVVAVLIAVFKLFFQLLISYIGLIFSTIFAPIILLFNAMPGSQSFSKWLKGIFANALVFPVAVMMLLLAAALTGEGDFGVAPDVGFNGSQGKYSQIALPLLGGGTDANALKAFIGVGILMMLPKIIELVQKALGVEGGLGGMMGAIMEPIQAGYGKTVAPLVGGVGSEAKYRAQNALVQGAKGSKLPGRLGAAQQAAGQWYVNRQKRKLGYDIKP